jgi:ribosomal protein S18 acetylase RimI-like enzyme
MGFDIRTASLLDLSGLHKLERECFQEDAWPLFDLVSVLSFPDVVRLKAVSDNHMVGFIAGDPRPTQNMAWIATLGVTPLFRKQGIGKALLDECERKLNYSRIRLCVRPANQDALNLYKRSGYQTIDRWKWYYNDKGDALVMEKIRL